MRDVGAVSHIRVHFCVTFAVLARISEVPAGIDCEARNPV
jgi:hypothetical protein